MEPKTKERSNYERLLERYVEDNVLLFDDLTFQSKREICFAYLKSISRLRLGDIMDCVFDRISLISPTFFINILKETQKPIDPAYELADEMMRQMFDALKYFIEDDWEEREEKYSESMEERAYFNQLEIENILRERQFNEKNH